MNASFVLWILIKADVEITFSLLQVTCGAIFICLASIIGMLDNKERKNAQNGVIVQAALIGTLPYLWMLLRWIKS